MSELLREPPFHEADTQPQKRLLSVFWGRFFLLLALLLLAGSIVTILWPKGSVPLIVAVPTSLASPTENPSLATIPTQENLTVGSQLPPLVPAQQLGVVLQAPLSENRASDYRYQPFTLINNERARTAFLDYVAVQGDTLEAIAERFGLQTESIAWCNERRIVQVLRPNDVVKIPPMDGACHRVLGSREETIASIAAEYQIDDPYSIIDSPYNYGQLPNGITPDAILAGGTTLFIPNGQGVPIAWNAASTQTDAAGNVLGVGFAEGLTGSCGSLAPSGGSFWGDPLPNGTWVRGFSSWHTGLDLAAPTGTPIYAANSGQVLFSGFSTWGYGQAVVIEHGGIYSTLYGHMSERNVSCGQSVVTGQVIGYVGSTGISTGPHLHFEIRVNGQTTDPSGTPGIGW